MEQYQQLIERIKHQRINFHIAPKIRFEGKTIEHHSFFLLDPSNNLLEFKHYTHQSAIFGETNFTQVGEND